MRFGGRKRGRLIGASDRRRAAALIKTAVADRARRFKACEELGISVRTCQRWIQAGGVRVDGRAGAKHPAPANKLSQQERDRKLAVSQELAYKDLSPSQIVPTLADAGEYIASESSVRQQQKTNSRVGQF